MLLNSFTAIMGTIRSSAKLIAILSLLCGAAALAAGISVNGTVLDSEGAAIAKARVVIRADASGQREPTKNPMLTSETDREGHFSAPVSPGFYDVCVMADAFSPQCQKILVGRESVTSRITLKADPEVMKRLGDPF